MGATASSPRPAPQPAQLRVRFYHSNLEAERPGGVAGRRNDPRRPNDRHNSNHHPLDTFKCHPDLNRRPALSRHEPAGDPTAVKATHRSADDEAIAKRVAHNDNSIIDGEWIADSGYYRQDGPTGTVVPT